MAGRPIHSFTVVATDQIAPHIVRVVLGGNGFDTFEPSSFADSYVKVVIVPSGVDVTGLPRPLTLDSFDGLPENQRPTVRTYTVRRADAERREVTIDFVVHGDHGVAAPWAANVRPGDPAYLMGPSGAYAPDPAADWYLFAGDEAAIPAISAVWSATASRRKGASMSRRRLRCSSPSITSTELRPSRPANTEFASPA